MILCLKGQSVDQLLVGPVGLSFTLMVSRGIIVVINTRGSSSRLILCLEIIFWWGHCSLWHHCLPVQALKLTIPLPGPHWNWGSVKSTSLIITLPCKVFSKMTISCEILTKAWRSLVWYSYMMTIPCTIFSENDDPFQAPHYRRRSLASFSLKKTIPCKLLTIEDDPLQAPHYRRRSLTSSSL